MRDHQPREVAREGRTQEWPWSSILKAEGREQARRMAGLLSEGQGAVKTGLWGQGQWNGSQQVAGVGWGKRRKEWARGAQGGDASEVQAGSEGPSR